WRSAASLCIALDETCPQSCRLCVRLGGTDPNATNDAPLGLMGRQGRRARSLPAGDVALRPSPAGNEQGTCDPSAREEDQAAAGLAWIPARRRGASSRADALERGAAAAHASRRPCLGHDDTAHGGGFALTRSLAGVGSRALCNRPRQPPRPLIEAAMGFL